MKSIIIYDSYFGNTKKIAETIASELNADAVNVKSFNIGMLDDARLIVVGSPTRAFQPSPNTKSFLAGLPKGSLSGKKAAAFDTGISQDDAPVKILKLGIKYFGYAAAKISRGLSKKGADICAEPAGFFVSDAKGPLKDGEIEKARKWAGKISAK